MLSMPDSILHQGRSLRAALPGRAWVFLARMLGGSEEGVSAIEYALIGALIAVAILAGVGAVGVEIAAMYTRVCNAVVGALGGGSC